MTARPAIQAPRPWHRHPGTIAAGVVAFHVLGLWALQSGLLRRAVETVVPAEILVEIMAEPSVAAAAPGPTKAVVAAPSRPMAATQPPPSAPPSVLAVPATAPVPAATVAVATNSVANDKMNTLATAPLAPETRTAKAAAVPPVHTPKVELPNSDVAELNNPKPAYPEMSNRLREEGVVVVNILVGTDGSAKDVQVLKSSGFDRLDQAAWRNALKLRFIPGKVDGTPQAMWRDKTYTFSLAKP